ncbi:MAG: hypothetical protein LBJ72_12290 [Dysgonamonadaceae bacterium]|jgi:hypothetical protein|nr:hypothetical protein [Dysgonamonadaceae bacterium]
MKRFIATKFIRSLQNASQKGIDIDAQILQDDYDGFVVLLFQDAALLQNKAAYRNTLIYTLVELTSLTEVSGKKCSDLSAKSN